MTAILSEDRVYRYTLVRDWPMLDGEERQGFGRSRAYAMVVGLNPSVADEVKDDPTIRRIMAFVKSWGYGMLVMVNLFSFRATNPKHMMDAKDPIGPDNDYWIEQMSKDACVIVAAWGKYGSFMNRDAEIIHRYSGLKCFGKNKDGSPRHPLYLRKDTKLVNLT